MNQVARVFVVINILLAAAFLMAAATFLHQSNDWKGQKEEADKQKTQLEEDLNGRIASLDQEVKTLTDDLNTRKAKITQLEGDLDTEKSKYDSAVEQKNKTESKFTKAQQTTNQLASSLDAVKSSVGGLEDMIENYRKRAEDAQDKEREAMAEKAKLVEERSSLKSTIREHENSIKDLQKRLADTTTELQAYRGSYPPPNNKSQPVIDGQVIRYDAATNMVQVNKGANDGVRLGHRFDILDGSTFICTVMVDYVEGSTSVGHIAIPSTSGKSPKSGNKATKLSGM